MTQKRWPLVSLISLCYHHDYNMDEMKRSGDDEVPNVLCKRQRHKPTARRVTNLNAWWTFPEHLVPSHEHFGLSWDERFWIRGSMVINCWICWFLSKRKQKDHQSWRMSFASTRISFFHFSIACHGIDSAARIVRFVIAVGQWRHLGHRNCFGWAHQAAQWNFHWTENVVVVMTMGRSDSGMGKTGSCNWNELFIG
jgi:hypothetical protein